MNVDGAFLPSIQYVGTWGVLRNAHGQFLAAFSHRVNFVSSPLHSELLALKNGLEMLQAMQITKVVVESDCQVAVQAVSNEFSDLSPFSALIAEVKGLLSDSEDVCIRFSPRQANTVAHRLASFSFDSNVHHEWFVKAPGLILDALMYDLNRT
ncbi:uncharacterized protein LOC133737772 [Rosa rugosa]|uniref:uncharacterized protein LOC133737772 n=1 Tax=Rosa rugosa TaxID=74645 RepID=UPI002B40BD9F|nr:uncharacterized protein LOC133737772 [Rosa rugosa]